MIWIYPRCPRQAVWYPPLLEPKTPSLLTPDLSLPPMACQTIPSSTRTHEQRLHNPTSRTASRSTHLSDTARTHFLTSTFHLDRSPPNNSRQTNKPRRSKPKTNTISNKRTRREIIAITTTEREICTWSFNARIITELHCDNQTNKSKTQKTRLKLEGPNDTPLTPR